MIIGYARTSTLEQVAGFEAQLRDLKAVGCEEIYKEQISSIGKRPQLETALNFIRKGDTLIVTKLDRLARSVKHLGEIIELIKSKGADLKIMDLGFDTSTPTGELILNVLGSVAQFERQMMLERQREGVAKAKSEGKYKGRKPTARAKSDEVQTLRNKGMKNVDIASELNIGIASVYRILKESKTESNIT
jgi:DNA invertase Pin-like site-specific DNA recombinase